MDVDNWRGKAYIEQGFYHARVAELVDALDLGSSSGDRMGVQVSPLAPTSFDNNKKIEEAFKVGKERDERYC